MNNRLSKALSLAVLCANLGVLCVASARGGTPVAAAATTVDLNTASPKELEALPGVGAATAKKIVAGRPYGSVDELVKAGVSAKTVEKLRSSVVVGSAPPRAATPAPRAPPAPTAASAAPSPSASAPAPRPSAAPSPKLTPGEKVNLNTASAEQLDALPGIGPVKAKAIMDGRPYGAPEDVMKVKGIKQGEFAKIKDSISVH